MTRPDNIPEGIWAECDRLATEQMVGGDHDVVYVASLAVMAERERNYGWIKRAIMNAKPRLVHLPRWTVVSHVFGCGSTAARELCQRHGFDPDEQVKR